MAFYTGRLVLHPAMENPTIVVITDRNDLDDQLFGTFSRCAEILRQTARAGREPRRPARPGCTGALPAGSSSPPFRNFCPQRNRAGALSDRRNIVVIADEAHRSQYDFIDGYARHHARCPAERLLYRVYRHADRAAATRTPGPCSAITSAFTISSRPSRTAPRSRFIMKAAWPSSSWTKTNAQDRPGVRRSHRRRRSREEGKTQDQMGGAGSHRRGRETGRV